MLESRFSRRRPADWVASDACAVVFQLCQTEWVLGSRLGLHWFPFNKYTEHFIMINRPYSIYEYSIMTPRFQDKLPHLVLFSLYPRIEKQNLTRKPRSHVRILIYQTWLITRRFMLQTKNWGNQKTIRYVSFFLHRRSIFKRLCSLLPRDLVTVFDAIFFDGQSGQQLQCLYRNPMAYNFLQNWISHNLWMAMLKYYVDDCFQ